MCMNSEAVEALHGIANQLKAEHENRNAWLADNEQIDAAALFVTRAEAEQIFAQRIAKHESKLEELGWRRTIRVEPSIPQPKPSDVAGMI